MPAATAAPMLTPAVLLPASTTTPMKPAASATPRRALIFSPKNTTATSAVNNTAIALQIAPTPAGARCAAHANSTNGIAELIAPISASSGHFLAGNSARSRHRNGSSTAAPSASRISTSANGPKSGAATRMNKKDAPQIAASTVSSMGVSQARVATGASSGVRAAAGMLMTKVRCVAAGYFPLAASADKRVLSHADTNLA